MARIVLKVTTTQLEAIKTAGDNLSATIGGGSGWDDEAKWIVKHIDKMLKDNNQKPRDFK